MRNLSAIRATVRQFIRDEFVSGAEQDFQDDEIDLRIAGCLVEISQKRPYEVKETLTTTAGSKELDISSIEDLFKVEKAEFPVGNEPPDYRNVEIFGNTLRLGIDFSPAGAQSVYLYCWKLHQLTESTSTLSPQLEKVLIDGSVAHTALGWINLVRKQVVEAIAKIADINTAIGNMTSATTGIEQAIKDLANGRTLGFNKVYTGGRPLDDYANFASRELGNANAYLSQSQGYIRELQSRLSISGLINTYQVWANNKMAEYQRELRGITKQRRFQLYSES